MKRLICLLLALFLLAGCTAAPDPTESSESTEPETESSAPEASQESERPDHFGLAYIPEYGFNPYQCVCITNRPVLSLVYEALFVLNSSFQPEPVLCESFAVSETGKNYLIRLCEDAAFSDGSRVTAEDVVASLKAAMDSPYYGSRFSKVASVTPVDPRTVRIDLYKAYENLPLLLDVPIVKAGTEEDERPIGSGPYAFSRGTGQLNLRRSRNWWQQRKAPVEYETILLTACSDPTEVRDSFEFGTTTLVCADLNAPNAVGYRCDYELWDCPTTIMQYIGFNLGSGVFLNRDFRAAVTHVINRESLISSVYKGFSQPAYLPCAPASTLYDERLAEDYMYDPEAYLEARNNVMINSEYSATLLVCSADPARVELAHRIADAFNQANTKVEVKSVDTDLYLYRLEAGQFDLFLGETRLSGCFDLTEFFKPWGSLCYGSIKNSAMEQLCYEALENTSNCYDLERNVMDGGYFCPLLFKSYAVMVERGAISNLQPAVDNVFHLPGGRTLSDATVTYEEMTNSGAPEESEENPG